MVERVEVVGSAEHPLRLVEDPASAQDNALLDWFLTYWHTHRGEYLPLKTSFKPTEVRGNLQWVLTADALPGLADFHYRAIGSRIGEYLLGAATGSTIREAFVSIPELGERVLSLFRLCCVKRIPVRMTGPGSHYDEIYYPAFDSLYLPYSSDGILADRVVNVYSFNRNLDNDVVEATGEHGKHAAKYGRVAGTESARGPSAKGDTPVR